MSDPFYGEIRMFAGSYAPRNWAFCDGQLYSINEYPELASLLARMFHKLSRDASRPMTSDQRHEIQPSGTRRGGHRQHAGSKN
jgi:microcystin-dependent protein